MFTFFRMIIIALLFTSSLIAENEPNNDCYQATPIALNSSSTGTLGDQVCSWYYPNGHCRYWTEDTIDYWTFTAQDDGTVNINTTGFPDNSDMDAYLQSNNCNQTFAKDDTNNANINLSYEVTKGTTYKLRLTNYRGSGNYTLNINFTPAKPKLNISDIAINEGDNGEKIIKVPVTLSRSLDTNISLDYTTSDYTATNRSDYVSTSGTLTFPAGTTVQYIPVIIKGDTIYEENENFAIILSNFTPSNNVKIEKGVSLVTIRNDDSSPNYTCPNPKEFSIASSQNIRGNILAIGNTNLCYNENGHCADPGHKRNNDINMAFVDIDGPSYTSTDNSSSATFSLPNTSTIKFAKLYWQGYLYQKSDSDKYTASHVLFKAPSQEYTPISAYDTGGSYNWIYFSSDRFYYQGSADVTELVKDAGSGTYTVANIFSTEGQPIGGSYGGWSLVIIYEDETTESLKNITIFDGYKGVTTQGDTKAAQDYANSNHCPSHGTGHEISIPLSGFLTPTTGDIKSSLLVFAGEGDDGTNDSNAKGDHIQLTDKNGVNRYIQNTLNSFDDIFNSTITYNGASVTNNTSPISINPYYSNNSNGIDIDTFDISKDKDGNTLIGNQQTSTTITLNTNGDGYMPGVFAFTTELYEPRVCYYIERIYDDSNTTVFEDKKFTGEIKNKTNYHFDIWISNMKKNASDSFLETAKFVQVYMALNNFDYTPSSTYMKNIAESGFNSKTDEKDIDTFEFESNQSTYRVGSGADGDKGGSLNPAGSFNDDSKKVFINFEGKFNIQNNGSSNIDLLDFLNFKASFQTDSITIGADNAQQIEQCVDLNTSAKLFQAALGSYNVVNEFSSISSSDPKQSNDVKNALLTQIANKPFNVKVLSLESDLTTLKTSDSSVILDMVNASNITQDQTTCDNAPVLYQNDVNMSVTFNGVSQVSKDLTLPVVTKNTTFRVKYIDWNGLWSKYGDNCGNSNMSANLKGVPQCYNGDTQNSQSNKLQALFDLAHIDISTCVTGANRACYSNMYPNHIDSIEPSKYAHEYGCLACLLDASAGSYVCARDNFSIRPASYHIDANETKLYGGKKYRFDINATLFNTNNFTTDYNQIIDNTSDKNITQILDIPSGCTLISPQTTWTNNLAFNDGQSDINYTYNNAGDINITIKDNEWSRKDQATYSAKAFSDCIENSSTNIPNASGKIGCLVGSTQQFTFLPKMFINTLALKNNNDGNFTYLSNDANMSAHINISIKAIIDDNTTTNDDNPTATNYTAKCFANDINTTVSLIKLPLATEWLTNDKNATERINFFSDKNTTFSEVNATGKATLSSREGNFTNGIANITIDFNFDRNTSILDEPFHISKNDFNISIIDSNDVNGSDFNRTTDINTTFYYGRVHAPEQTFNGNNGNANIYYEVYCKDCNRTSLNIAGNESVDSIYWYQNTLHVISDGNVSVFNPDGNVLMAGNLTSKTTAINQGNETQAISVATPPYTDKIVMTPNSWLIYNPANSLATTSDFLVHFLSQGTWGGEGSVKEDNTVSTGRFVQKDNNITQVQRRIDW